jgi:hypothetical protein
VIRLNPFIYGTPVPPHRLVDQEHGLHIIFSRIRNGESTAIIGEPHIGKTSLLHYIVHPRVRRDWLGEEADRYIFVEVDCLALPTQGDVPRCFWEQALSPLKETPPVESIRQQLRLVSENEFRNASLWSFFKFLAHEGYRLILLLDEFETLWGNPACNNVEFFGGLRSLAINTDGLQLVVASRMSISELNQRTLEINPYGSPFFNHFVEVKPGPFSRKTMDGLLNVALTDTSVHFSPADRDFIDRLSGRSPYRIQAAAAALFEASVEELSGENRYASAADRFYESIADAHFSDMWRRLDDKARIVAVILSLVEVGGMAQGRDFAFGEIERAYLFEPELRKLSRLGLVEQVSKCTQWDTEHLLLWQGGHWRISSLGFAWWVYNTVIADSQTIPDPEDWLRNKEVFYYLFSRQEWERVKNWAAKSINLVPGGIGGLIRLLLKSLDKSED